MSLDEKLAKIREPNLEGQKHVRHVLSSIEETLREQQTPLSPTAYFAASLALLKQTVAQNANAGPELIQSIVYLLDLITSHVPPALLRSQLSPILASLSPLISQAQESGPLLRSTIGCYESLLLAQDSASWALPQSQPGPRQAMPALLSVAIDPRPKVRKRAQEAVTKVLQNPPPGPALDHPAAELCAVAAQNNLKHAIEVVQQAKRHKGRPDDSHEPAVIHALQLTKTIAIASGGWPSKKIEQLCELLLSISRSTNDYLVMSAFEVFEVIFQSMTDEVSSSKLPRLLTAILELKPAQNDSQLLPPWIAIVSRGFGTAAEVEPQDTFAKLPELFDLIAEFLTSPSHNIRISASECLISFFANCIPDSVISEPSIYDEKILEQLASRALGLLAVKYQTAWMEVFKVLSAVFEALRWRGDPYLLPVVVAVGGLRGNDGFQGKSQADQVLGSAIASLGPAAVLAVLPHNLLKPTKGQPGRAWLLPLLRDHVSNTNLAHFKSDLLPLSQAMFQRVLEHGDADKTVDIKIFETVVHQVWAIFPGYCDLPLDLTLSIDQQFAELLSNLLYQQTDLRVSVCRGLQNLVESNQALLASDLDDEVLLLERRLRKSDAESNISHLSSLTSNLLAVLFNVYSQTLPQSRAYIIQCVNAYLSITPEKDLVDTFDRVSKMLKSELPAPNSQPPPKPRQQEPRNKMPPTSHTLFDLVITLSVHLPRQCFASLFALAHHILTNPNILQSDPQLIKKAYKLIPRLATSQTGAEALRSRNPELRQLIIDTADKTPVPARRDRILAIQTLIDFLPDSDLHFISAIISEVVLACKDSNEKARNAGFDLLLAVAKKIIDSPEGTVIKNSLVPTMPSDSPDAPATVGEVFSMVSAGLAGVAPHVVAASIIALSRLLWEYHDQLDREAETEIVSTVLLFIESNNREIVRAVLGFVKVVVVRCPKDMLEPKMPEIVKGMMVWSKENKGRLRQKVRGILERCLRKWNPDLVESWVGGEDRKMVVNIRKRKERTRRKKKGDDYDDEDGEETTQRYDNEFDKAVYGSDDDSEIIGSDGEEPTPAVTLKPGRKGEQYIRQDEDDEPLDLLDPKSMASISSKKLGRLKDTRRKRPAKTQEDGKLVFGHDDADDDVLMEGGGPSGGVDAYIDAVAGPNAVRRGQKGKLKIKSAQRKSDDMELDEDDAREVGRKMAQSPRSRGGSFGGKTKPQNARKGLGVEKTRGQPQRQKFRGGNGLAMAEPWLDSLSEDWESERHSSSPAASVASRRRESSNAASLNRSSHASHTRIPHLAPSVRKDSAGHFLKHRSQRSLSRAKTEPVLASRSASSLNVPSSQRPSHKGPAASSTLPRNTSNAFSESQNSVQHYSVRGSISRADTPEWKKKLVHGDDIDSDGFDLFAPSKLEGIFKEPAGKPGKENDGSLLDGLSKPWDSYKSAAGPPVPPVPSVAEQYQSMRASRTRPPGMEVLPEEDEDEAGRVLPASAEGIVHKRVQSLEKLQSEAGSSPSRVAPSPLRPHAPSAQYSVSDPRWRTISGRQEIENETISPITSSRQDTIRDRVLKESTDVDIASLDQKLAALGVDEQRRPSSSYSDREVSYFQTDAQQDADVLNTHVGDITSQSLPDDLSMGTQDFISHGGYINQRRGAPSGEVSALKTRQSSTSFRQSHLYPSSPPAAATVQDQSTSDLGNNQEEPAAEPQDESVVHVNEAAPEPRSPRSPLKLFGTRDTYTNSKLMRILSQFDESKDSQEHQDEEVSVVGDQSQSALRMSHFGKGDLENYNFEFEKPLSGSPKDRQELELDGSPIFKPQPQDDTFGQTQTAMGPAQEPSSKAQSPIRTPKRRRTLVKEGIDIGNQHLELKLDELLDTPAPVADESEADGVRSGSAAPTRPSVSKIPVPRQISGRSHASLLQVSDEVAQGLAAELASFAQEAVNMNTDSRKPSLATKDYMEEANKVMQFIRNRGKPQPTLPEISEPNDQSELDPDKILDLDIDDESTKDNFSRPPSREGPRRSSPDRRHAVHDPETASYLRRYQEDDDGELVANTSVMVTFRAADNRHATAISEPDSEEAEQESSPPNMRILDPSQSLRKRKYSASTVEGQTATQIHSANTNLSSKSTSLTFPTSSSSGHKGMITSGTVSIPDQVGKMTYDHTLQRWVSPSKAQAGGRRKAYSERTAASEADPFENIPDLSIDEKEEEARLSSRPGTLDTKAKEAVAATRLSQEAAPNAMEEQARIPPSPQPMEEQARIPPSPQSMDEQAQIPPSPQSSSKPKDKAETKDGGSLRSEASQHEARLHDGIASQPPSAVPEGRKQARVVTIAFSSPVVSAVQYPDELSDLDEEVDLPLDDSELSCTPQSEKKQGAKAKDDKYEDYRAMSLNRRPVSRIDEEKENADQAEMELVHVSQDQDMTPLAKAQHRQIVHHRQVKAHNSSILCLTPLSDFTLHQVDQANHPEESFVEERANPKALRQANGSLALQIDALVKAVTDEEPSEIYWERIRKMRLEKKNLSSVYGLMDYCGSLEQLSVANNQVSHLDGLPRSLRVLDIHSNALTSLVCWTGLVNLQYLDVSKNQLDTLDGFGCLIHLRKLVANGNQISNIDGILELDGLLELQVRENQLAKVDFTHSALDRLRKLDLSHNQLAHVGGVHHLISLEELDLAHNLLTTTGIEESAGMIKRLDVSRNQISDIDLTPLPALQWLNADCNRLKDVQGLSAAYHLGTLFLRAQGETSNIVSDILSTPNECRSIALSSNAVPGGMIKLPCQPQCNVRELELASCGIAGLGLDFGDVFPNCRTLNLNYNAIRDVSELQGMARLAELSIARNRVKRMRRTCLALARLGKLSKLDLRDNPLTLGYYAPPACEQEKGSGEQRFMLPEQDGEEDARWFQILDETTQLRRRTVELLLAQGCPNLKKFDGLTFNERADAHSDSTWQKLTCTGVLRRPTDDDSAVADQATTGDGSVATDLDEGIDMESV
ncbi:hypothetical protein DV735_g4531, partial [Chaetothyriales sp. CBS 134920]